MDENRYELRAFRDADYAAVAALQNANYPEEPVSVESLRHLFDTLFRDAGLHQVVVVDRGTGEVVGGGGAFRLPFETDSARLGIVGSVLPAHQREGIGSHVYDALASAARRRGASALSCRVWERSTSGRAFLASHGFVERRRHWRSRLEVASADASPLAPLARSLEAGGIELTTLAREGARDSEVLTRVYELHAEAAQHVPREGTYTPIPFDQFRRFFLEGESTLPDAWFLAKAEGRYVGISQGARDPARPDVLQQYFTGTLPEFRRRKIALALKLMLVDYAQRNGYAFLETTNDSLNLPMWALNRGLGFQKVRETIQLEARLAES
jgi:mycothiol synthase